MVKFTSLFLNNLFMEFSPMVASASTSSTGVYTLAIADEVYKDNSSLGTALTSLGTNVILGLDAAYDNTISQLQDTQAYVESLTEEELSELIYKLEAKDYLCETKDRSVAVKKKTN